MSEGAGAEGTYSEAGAGAGAAAAAAASSPAGRGVPGTPVDPSLAGEVIDELAENDCAKARKRRRYPDPGFAVERLRFGAVGGIGSYTVRFKLRAVAYTRALCSDGKPVGNDGAAKVLGLGRKCIISWVREEKIKGMLKDMIRYADEAINERAKRVELGYLDPDDELLVALREERADLDMLSKQTRAQWLKALSIELISKCRKGKSEGGGRRSRSIPAKARISTKGLMIDGKLAHLDKRRLCCESRLCASRTTPVRGRTDGLRGKRVDTACLCKPCSAIGGVVMCKQCYGDEKKHQSALQFAASSQKDGKHRVRTQFKFRVW